MSGSDELGSGNRSRQPAGDPRAADSPLTAEEEEILDRYSGTTPNLAAVQEAVLWTRHALANTIMPNVPYIDVIRAALAEDRTEYEAVTVKAFLENARIYDHETDREVTASVWLQAGRDPQPVLDLANSLTFGT